MPFHIGGHKPHPRPARTVSVASRLFVTLMGIVLIVGGVFRIQRGFDYVLNWWGEPVYSYGLIIAGVIVVPLAWVPTRWSDKAFEWAAKRSRGE